MIGRAGILGLQIAVVLLLAPSGARAGSSEPQRAGLAAPAKAGSALPKRRLTARERWEAATRAANRRAEALRKHQVTAKGEG